MDLLYENAGFGFEVRFLEEFSDAYESDNGDGIFFILDEVISYIAFASFGFGDALDEHIRSYGYEKYQGKKTFVPDTDLAYVFTKDNGSELDKALICFKNNSTGGTWYHMQLKVNDASYLTNDMKAGFITIFDEMVKTFKVN